MSHKGGADATTCADDRHAYYLLHETPFYPSAPAAA